MFSSLIAHFNPSKTQSNHTKSNVSELLKHVTLKNTGVFESNYTLYHHNTSLSIDILLFLPYHGIYFGEKVSWKASDLTGANVEHFNKQTKKTPTTHLGSIEETIRQKLQDILSFDSTPIERFFLMEHLNESEFDALHTSFHLLLPKNRLIFADDTVQTIEKKLFSLAPAQENEYSQLKILGSLQAHKLLIPNDTAPFGQFLSNSQEKFLAAKLAPKSTTILCGGHASGKTTVLIRKVLQSLLEDPSLSILVVTPTLLAGELFYEELIALCEFAIIDIDFSRLHFYHPQKPNTKPNLDTISPKISMIIYEDFSSIDPMFIQTIDNQKQSKTIIISDTLDNPPANSYFLEETYRLPTLQKIHFTHTKGARVALLTKLQELLAQNPHPAVLIVVNNTQSLLDYKQTLDEHLKINTKVLSCDFSLQYTSLDFITLATGEYTVGLHYSHCFIVNLETTQPLYSLALSRASESVTIISEEI